MKTTFTTTHFAQHIACCDPVNIEKLMALPPKKRKAAVKDNLLLLNDFIATAKKLMAR